MMLRSPGVVILVADVCDVHPGMPHFIHGAGRTNGNAGAGITWGSDPTREWVETELKAERLIGLASGRGGGQ